MKIMEKREKYKRSHKKSGWNGKQAEFNILTDVLKRQNNRIELGGKGDITLLAWM